MTQKRKKKSMGLRNLLLSIFKNSHTSPPKNGIWVPVYSFYGSETSLSYDFCLVKMAKVQPSITVIPEKNLASKAYKSGVLMRLFLCWREEDAMLKDVMHFPVCMFTVPLMLCGQRV